MSDVMMACPWCLILHGTLSLAQPDRFLPPFFYKLTSSVGRKGLAHDPSSRPMTSVCKTWREEAVWLRETTEP